VKFLILDCLFCGTWLLESYEAVAFILAIAPIGQGKRGLFNCTAFRKVFSKFRQFGAGRHAANKYFGGSLNIFIDFVIIFWLFCATNDQPFPLELDTLLYYELHGLVTLKGDKSVIVSLRFLAYSSSEL